METIHFKNRELKCKCGCGLQNIQEESLLKLEKARQIYGKPISLTSASRCKEHNKKEGGKENSSHLIGEAFDIACDNSKDRFLIIQVLLKAGFTRIGIARTFIHCDDDRNKPTRVCWLY